MNNKSESEEYLEVLWRMKERKQDSIDSLKKGIGEDFNNNIIDKLVNDGQVSASDSKSKINLTDKGEDHARKIIRAHRLAEKLICDALGVDFDAGACEFEHIINTDLIDSICTMLGHPKVCPHGNPIPEGECCKRAAKTVRSSVTALSELAVGMSGTVAYVNYSDDIQLNKMDTLKIKTGGVIKLLQKSPSYVVSCEGADVALDYNVASSIFLWNHGGQFNPGGENMFGPGKLRRKRGFGFMRRKSV